MSLNSVVSDDFDPEDTLGKVRGPNGVAPRPEVNAPSGGIYSLPVVGPAAVRTRQFYDEMAPNETDSTEVRAAKEVFRWGSVAVGAAAVAVVVL